MTSRISCLMSSATVPSAPPSPSEPTSPMKMSAGWQFHHRKPRLAPTSAPQKIVSSAASDRSLTQLQVLSEHEVRRDVRQRREGRRRNREHADGQAVQTVRQIDRVGCADQHEHGKRHVEPAEVRDDSFEKRKDQPRVVQRWFLAGEDHQRNSDGQADHDLPTHLVARPQAVMRAADDLQIVVNEANQAERQRRDHRNPGEGIGEIRPTAGSGRPRR